MKDVYLSPKTAKSFKLVALHKSLKTDIVKKTIETILLLMLKTFFFNAWYRIRINVCCNVSFQNVFSANCQNNDIIISGLFILLSSISKTYMRKYSVIRLSNNLENPRWRFHGFISKPAIFNATSQTNCFLVWHCGGWKNCGLLHVWLTLWYNFQTNDFAAFTLLRKEMGLCPGIEHLLVKQVCNASCYVDEFGKILSGSSRRVPLQDKIFIH